VRLKGNATTSASVESVERQIKGNFTENRSSKLHRGSVFKNGELLGEWVRDTNGLVIRKFP